MKTSKEIIALIDAEIYKCKSKALKLVPCKTNDQYNEWYRLLGAVNALEAIKEGSKDLVDHFKEGFQEGKEKELKRKHLEDLVTQGWALTELRVKSPKQPEPSKLEIIKVLSEALIAVNGVNSGVAGMQTHQARQAQETISRRIHELIDTLPVPEDKRDFIFLIDEVGFTSENNHGYLKLRLPYGYDEMEGRFKKGDSVTVQTKNQ